MNKFKLLSLLTLIIAAFQINAGEIDFTDGAGNNLTTFQQVIQGTSASAGAVATFMNPIVDSGPNVFFILAMDWRLEQVV
jgi:hypothetical protein